MKEAHTLTLGMAIRNSECTLSLTADPSSYEHLTGAHLFCDQFTNGTVHSLPVTWSPFISNSNWHHNCDGSL